MVQWSRSPRSRPARAASVGAARRNKAEHLTWLGFDSSILMHPKHLFIPFSLTQASPFIILYAHITYKHPRRMQGDEHPSADFTFPKSSFIPWSFPQAGARRFHQPLYTAADFINSKYTLQLWEEERRGGEMSGLFGD